MNVLSLVKQVVGIAYQENPYSEINFLQDFTPLIGVFGRMDSNGAATKKIYVLIKQINI